MIVDEAMSDYQAPLFFRNGHRQSIYPTIFRKVGGVNYRRERITTPDDDFLDLDWMSVKSDKLTIISHGLEGNSSRAYVKGMVKAVTDAGFDALAWNFRGCGGTINRQPKLYHSGSYKDLETVIEHVFQHYEYREINLIGFSMGGNISLIYLGRKENTIDQRIKKCVVFSVPCDLKAGSEQIGKPANQIYMKRFLRLLHEKIRAKKAAFPDLFDDHDYAKIKNFYDFDNRYTAPLHGFVDAEDYWRQCSSKQFIKDIRVPTLLVSALDDPFLAQACYPFSESDANPQTALESPKHGGHVGFVTFNRNHLYWSEKRCVTFLQGYTC
ncbi:MAG: alpha/beta fold hydrolase [Pseudomonadota bacterium]|nr:alpha/beta fold hydrolase [Pseudomonadota bacterium]